MRGQGEVVSVKATGFESAYRAKAVPAPKAPAGSREATVPSEEETEDVKSAEKDQPRCFGRYRVLEELGHGGQGIVFKAHDTVLERDVALKVLHAPFQNDSKMSALFRHEALTAARLNHPHIIPIFDFGMEQGCAFLTMPLIEGPSLDRVISAGLPLGFCLRVLVQAGEALSYAHEKHVIHLDLKPGNILLRYGPPGGPGKATLRDPGVLVTDFTMAQMVVPDSGRSARKGSRTRFGGTLRYAAPEQIAGERALVGPATDFYSLGVVFYEMLTGRPLIDFKDPSATQLLMLQGNVAPPSSRRAGLPPEVDTLCLELLHHNPKERIQNGQALVERALPLLGTLG